MIETTTTLYERLQLARAEIWNNERQYYIDKSHWIEFKDGKMGYTDDEFLMMINNRDSSICR